MKQHVRFSSQKKLAQDIVLRGITEADEKDRAFCGEERLLAALHEMPDLMYYDSEGRRAQ